MRKFIAWTVTSLGALGWLISQIGNAQTVKDLWSNQGPILRVITSVSQFWPLAVFIAGVLGLVLIRFGSPQSWFMRPTRPEPQPIFVAIDQLRALLNQGQALENRFQFPEKTKPTFEECVAWNDEATACARQRVFAPIIRPSDIARFSERWDEMDCRRAEAKLDEHGCLEGVDDIGRAVYRYQRGRVRRLQELMAKVDADGETEHSTLKSLAERYGNSPRRSFKQIVEDQTIVLPTTQAKLGLQIDALPPIPDTLNMTQHIWHEGARVTFTGDIAVSVENVLPSQGIDLVNFRLMSITPPLKAKKAWKPSTQDSILKRIQFVEDMPKNTTLNPGITAEVRLFKVTRPPAASSLKDILLWFYGNWPEGHGVEFIPGDRHTVVVEVTGNGVARAEATLEMTFSTDPARPALTWVRLDPSSPVAPPENIIVDKTPHDLLTCFRGRTALQGMKMIEPYVGRSIETEGKILNLYPHNGGVIAVIRTHLDQDTIECPFDHKWRETLLHNEFMIGFTMKVRGKIAGHQNGSQFYLVECELV
jgi:hypothetical protein